MRVEILTGAPMAARGERMLAAMIAAAPMKCRVGAVYKGDCDLLMVYGTGHPIRRPWWNEHLRSGRHTVGWDLGYWNRDKQTMRLTIDADHPHKLIATEDPEAWDLAGIELRNDSKPAGPVIIVGMSAKANRIHLMGRLHWELRAARQAQKLWPQREVLYRPKRESDPPLPGFKTARGPIEDALLGASMVLCRHSNVAVDACIAGVPVRCEDGAAYALYQHGEAPTPEQRLNFLRSLAHWQYTPDGAALAWNKILKHCV